ncbi:MAG: ABC transporter ATP-binding protein/permease [Chitinivibrionia bacterium]|nr:ABC transporter ATP-binding protein/permease [Chitinivibrionia bacterium]
MSIIFKFMKPYTLMLCGVFVFILLEVMTAIALPGRTADIVNDGVIVGNIPTIWRNGGIMLLLTVASVIVALISGVLIAKIATGICSDLRSAVFKKIMSFSNAEMNKFATSSLITRTTNDITQVQTALMLASRQFIFAPMIAIGGIIAALDRAPNMTWVLVLVIIFMVGSMATIVIIALPKFNMIQGLIDRLNLVSRENLSGILIVRAFGTQNFEKKRFDKANRDATETGKFIAQAFAFVTPVILLTFNFTAALIVWVGAHEVSAFRSDIGDIFAFMQYGILIVSAFLMISVTFIFVPRAIVSARRISEVLNTQSSIKYRENPIDLPKNLKGEIEFRNVSFRYPETGDDDVGAGSARPADQTNDDETVGAYCIRPKNKHETETIIKNGGDLGVCNTPLQGNADDNLGGQTPPLQNAAETDNENVLERVNFTAKSGETTAIIGATGAGKTTILNLILRFYDVNEGAILIDGIDIRDVSKKDLHDKIGYVPQKAHLFSGNIRSNLLLADKEASEERIQQAVEISQSQALIEAKPGGYEANVAQGGTNFSGGQRQRLAIARALVKKSAIHLFDDSFSALDLKTDALLREALKKKSDKSTKIIVAQRISSIMDADQIVVLDDGVVVGKGKHSQLLETCEVYKEIAASQMSEEELVSTTLNDRSGAIS